jgi:propanol-preferring alcohol dehydrogenase
MRAIRLIQPGKQVELHELPLPQVGAGDVLVRVKAAGICHSDAHYRAGISRVHPLPLTLGHEVAGVVEKTGSEVTQLEAGARVCVHYLSSCGACLYCQRGIEQFCQQGAMMGKYRDGGYADFVVMPARSILRLPDEISFAHGAVLMCSSATCLHALNQARLKPGETVAIFGVGGLGSSAIQLAKAYGAARVFGVDIRKAKLELAQRLGAIGINALEKDPVRELHTLTQGRGVDVALELVGLPLTMRQAVCCLAIKGRAALAGITEKSFEIGPYAELLNKEAEVIGVSDHLAQELPLLLEWARQGKLDLSKVVTRTVPLQADAVNEMLDRLEGFDDLVRVVIEP